MELTLVSMSEEGMAMLEQRWGHVDGFFFIMKMLSTVSMLLQARQ